MRPFDGQRVLLGVTGGIACYKSASIARLLTQAGAEVDVVMTASATQFIAPVTFEALTGRHVHTALIAAGHALEHITLARAASLIVVAPTTADTLARIAGAHADDLLGAILLAASCPVLLVPAMNDRMWAHPGVTRNVGLVTELGYRVLEPADGPLAVGEGSGPGRMPEPEDIVAHAAALLEPRGPLHGGRVVVTAGPTREAVDPVRYLSNRSSGKMGVEIAAAAFRRGARVTLIAGPLQVPTPVGADVVHVETNAEMRDAVAAALGAPGSPPSALIMAAAPADFRPADPAQQKLKKADGLRPIALTAAEDILLTTRFLRPAGMIAVGFALETGDPRAEGSRKLRDKGLDLVVANDANEAGAGFGGDTNRVTMLLSDGQIHELPLQSKREVAEAILDQVCTLLAARSTETDEPDVRDGR